MNFLYLLKLFIEILFASLLGFLIDDIGHSIQKKNNLNPPIMMISQIIFNIFLIFYFRTHLQPYFTRGWLDTIRGLLFATLFFNVQQNLYKNIELTYKNYFSK
jgi:hypothetical protein